MDLTALPVRAAADQEGTRIHRQRHVGGVPASAVEVEVLAVLEAEQRDRGDLAAGDVAAEEDEVIVLGAAELVGDEDAAHQRVPHPGAAVGADAGAGVRLGGDDGVGHEAASRLA